MKSLPKSVHRILGIFIVSLLITVSTGAIVTGRNVPAHDITTLKGEEIVNLPCIGEDRNWRSDIPTLPETRGLPLNYNFWNPCYGTQVIRNGFIFDLLFWYLVTTAVYTAYLYNRKRVYKKESSNH